MLKRYLGSAADRFRWDPDKPLPAAANDNVKQTALLVIDVQEKYVNNQETKEKSTLIASTVPAFRAAGIHVYAIYLHWRPLKLEKVRFKFPVDPADTIVRKHADSAFMGSNIESLLRSNGHRSLLTCGFNTNYCVKDTVIDACQRGFKVRLLHDLIGNGLVRDDSRTFTTSCINEMESSGAIVTTSADALFSLKPRP